MGQPIALVTRLDSVAEEDWLTQIAALLPQENILSFRAMSAAQKEAAEIAIVANPDPAQVAALPRLAWIQSLWAGVERLVDELGASSPPIVRLVDPELSRVMAESVLAWTYYLQRDMPAYRGQQAARCWRPLPYRAPSSVRVGVLGLGALGLAAARRLVDAGFTVSGWSRSPKAVDGINACCGEDGLTQLLQNADIVVCLLPLTPQTRGLLHAGRLRAMKAGASLINFARGPIVPAADLIRLLDEKHIAHAVLDVFDQEPLPEPSELWMHAGVTILPHVAAPTDRCSAARIVADNIKSYRATGALPSTVDRERGY